MASLTAVIDDERVNAVLSWLLVLLVAVVVGATLLAGKLLWAALAVVVGAVALVPAAMRRDPSVMAPWELLALATLPLVGRSFGPLTEIATYFAVAALALLVAVEIHAFSSAEMSPRFAVAFVVVTTMAIAGAWAIAQWVSDAHLDTAFLTDNADLMWELVLASCVGVAAGVLFELYFRRYEPAGARPVDARERDGP